MNTGRILGVLLLAEIVVLLGFAAASFRDYQDVWILEGLEIPFAIIVVTYGAYIFVEKDVKRLLLFSLLFRLAWILVPQIKYPWFHGVAVDQHTHYRFAKDIHDAGFIPSERTYSGTPLMHVSFATYSLISGVSVLDSFKYLPTLWWGVYPLFVYLLLEKSQLGKSNPSILKYAVVIACIPARTTLSYVIVGATFGTFLVFLFLYQLVRALQTNASQHWLLAILCSIALVSAHAYSSTTLLFVFTLTFAVSAFLIRRFRFPYLKITWVIFLAVLNIAWLLYQAPVLYGSARVVIRAFLDSIQGLPPGGGVGAGFSLRLFELDVVNASKTLVVFHGADLFLSLLMVLGVLCVARKLRSSTPFRFVALFATSAWVYYVVQLAMTRATSGLVTYNRIFDHTLILAPILGAVALYYLKKKTRSSLLVMVPLSMLLILAPIELYHCQPLIPSASTISELLPPDEPVVYLGIVNSIYQRNLIRHVEEYVETGFIASDKVTANQILGLIGVNFTMTHVMSYYPFTWLIDNTTRKKEYDYFLIHISGRAGALQQPAEIRTPSLVQAAIYNSSVTYNNGESYMLQSPFMYEGWLNFTGG